VSWPFSERNAARAGRLALVCAILIASALPAQADPPRPDFPASAPSVRAESRLARLLRQPVDIRFDGTRLKDVLLTLASRYGLPITFDPELADRGIDLDREVTLISWGGALGNVLTDVLSGGDLICVEHGETLMITTRFASPSNLEWRTYPVGDLVRAGFSLRDLRSLVVEAVFSEWDNEVDEEKVGPAVVASENNLLVLQTDAKQQLIARLFEELLRRSRSVLTTGTDASDPLLDRRVSVDFDSIPFAEFVHRLRLQLGVPIIVLRDPSQTGLEADPSITLHVPDISVGSLLGHVGQAFPNRLAAVARQGELLIAPADTITRMPNLRLYDLRDLLHRFNPSTLSFLIHRYTGNDEDWEDTEAQASARKEFWIGGFLAVNQPWPGQRAVAAFLQRIRRCETTTPARVPLSDFERCERRLRGQLAASVVSPSGGLVTVPLYALPEWLRTQCGLPVRLDMKSLTHLNPEIDVVLRFDGRPLEETLQRALDPLGLVVVIEQEMVLIADNEHGNENRDTRIYPAWRHLWRSIGDQQLDRLAREATDPFLSDDSTEPDEDQELSIIMSAGGLVFARARPRLQWAIAAKLGWSDYEAGQMAEWPIGSTSKRGVALGSVRQVRAKSRINP
jgi:hypothetical protein